MSVYLSILTQCATVSPRSSSTLKHYKFGGKSKCCFHKVAHRVLRTVCRFYYLEKDFNEDPALSKLTSRVRKEKRKEIQKNIFYLYMQVQDINPTENISADQKHIAF